MTPPPRAPFSASEVYSGGSPAAPRDIACGDGELGRGEESCPRLREHPPGYTPSKTRQLADRLDAIAYAMSPGPERAKLWRLSDRLHKCIARDAAGHYANPRCGQSICPRCQRRTAIRFNKRLTAFIASVPASRLRFLRLSVIPELDTPDEGYRILTESLHWLRHRAVWYRAVEAGLQHIELAATDGDSARLWNVHAHLVVLLFVGAQLDADELSAGWTAATAKHYATGSLHLVQRVRL